jgi:ribosomal protein L37E
MEQPTYVIPIDGAWIKCQRCGYTSHNEHDVRERYCSRCHVFHDDAAKIRALETSAR